MQIEQLPILSLLLIVPLCGFLLLLLIKESSDNAYIIKCFASVFAIASFFLSVYLLLVFDYSADSMQFIEKYEWMPSYNIYYQLGIDGVSLYFIPLTTFLTLLCIVISWNSIKKGVKKYFALFLLLEALVIGVFVAQDLILFYLFFEAVLIPMFLIIGVWGGENRVYAAYKFFLYTFFGSVLMLIGVLYIYFTTEISDMQEIVHILPQYTLYTQKWLWIAFFISFAIKIPMWPVHTWLPDAHVQAPTAGSVMLAGILLKMGGYGFLRFSVPMLPMASQYFADLVFVLSIIAVIYASFVALVQSDMKKLIAYSSVAHMGYVTAGIFTLQPEGVCGAVFQMISHGLISSGLFVCVGVLYERAHTKEIKFYGGLANRMPSFALFLVLLSFASFGLPGTSGFIGEFAILASTFDYSHVYGALMALGMVLGAAYMLWLVARVVFCNLNSNVNAIKDCVSLEKFVLYSLAIVVVAIGIYPSIITSGIQQSTWKIVEPFAVSMQNAGLSDELISVLQIKSNKK